MHAARVRRAEELFQAAVDLPAQDRPGFLRQQCDGDDGLREFVAHLLKNYDQGSGDFLDSPLFATVAAGAATPGAADFPARIGDYEVIRLIGEGGMGRVYEARQTHPRRTVAIKVIRPGPVSHQMLKRFEREAHILGRLHHPGIAQVYEAGLITRASLTGCTSPWSTCRAPRCGTLCDGTRSASAAASN